MITRYAYIVDGETRWGPGVMPYFLNLVDGTMWEITAHSVEESESVGIFVVEQIGYVEDLDERFYQWAGPEYSIVDGRPRETHRFHFIPAARDNMIKGVDDYAEEVRQLVATKYPGQYQEYERVYNEAIEVNSLPLDQEIEPGTYPFLEADVGVTKYWDSERLIENLREAAFTVLNTRDFWNKVAYSIRKSRLLTKKLIKEAETDEEAMVHFNEFCSKHVLHFWQDTQAQ
jgi:hypothetical protein